MRHRMYVHLVWTTLDRRPMIDLKAATFLAAYLPRIAKEERGELMALGMVSTHLHVLLRIQPMTALPRLIQRMKGGSSAIGRKEHNIKLHWSSGYNIETVSEGGLPRVSHYIDTQHENHPEEAIAGWPADSKR
jgi:putative transposase